MFSYGGGGPKFSEGPILIPMVTYKTSDFPGGGPDPCSSLDPCMLLL